MRTLLAVTAMLIAVALAPSSATAAVCADHPNQAAAQAAADTIDADGDGRYCESLPCPCSTGGGDAPSPPAAPPAPAVAPPPPAYFAEPPAVTAPPPPAAATSSGTAFTVTTRDYRVSRIGPFRPARNPVLSAAIRAFGKPTSRKLDGRACRVEWRRLRLRITFASLGVTRRGQTTCTPSVGRAQSFVARSPRFRPINDLRVGQPTTAIRVKHPQAEFQPAGYWAVVLARFPFGDSVEPLPVLKALTSGGRVVALSGYVGGAGE